MTTTGPASTKVALLPQRRGCPQPPLLPPHPPLRLPASPSGASAPATSTSAPATPAPVGQPSAAATTPASTQPTTAAVPPRATPSPTPVTPPKSPAFVFAGTDGGAPKLISTKETVLPETDPHSPGHDRRFTPAMSTTCERGGDSTATSVCSTSSRRTSGTSTSSTCRSPASTSPPATSWSKTPSEVRSAGTFAIGYTFIEWLAGVRELPRPRPTPTAGPRQP